MFFTNQVNPYRVNIGSIGIVPSNLDGMLVSQAYVVVRPVNKQFPGLYILSLLKSDRYKKIIANYSLGSARASLSFDELKRIKIPIPESKDIPEILELQKSLDEKFCEISKTKTTLDQIISKKINGK